MIRAAAEKEDVKRIYNIRVEVDFFNSNDDFCTSKTLTYTLESAHNYLNRFGDFRCNCSELVKETNE